MATKNVKKTDEEETVDIKELFVALGPLIDKLSPIITLTIEANAPIIRRGQWMNFTIMMVVVIGIILLAYSGKIDGSAATGLLGAVIGYVFGTIFSNKERK